MPTSSGSGTILKERTNLSTFQDLKDQPTPTPSIVALSLTRFPSILIWTDRLMRIAFSNLCWNRKVKLAGKMNPLLCVTCHGCTACLVRPAVLLLCMLPPRWFLLSSRRRRLPSSQPAKRAQEDSVQPAIQVLPLQPHTGTRKCVNAILSFLSLLHAGFSLLSMNLILPGRDEDGPLGGTFECCYVDEFDILLPMAFAACLFHLPQLMTGNQWLFQALEGFSGHGWRLCFMVLGQLQLYWNGQFSRVLLPILTDCWSPFLSSG